MTPAPPAATIAIRVGRRDGRTVVTQLAGAEPWCPRVIGPGRGRLARVALVQTRAGLLCGDRVALAVDVGDGCALELVELGATIAHHVRGGAPARLDAQVRVGRGARLVWLAQPLIAAAGCDVLRSTSIDLADGAAALVGEALVLGRRGELPGSAHTRTRITLEGRPVLDEALDTEPAWLLRSHVVVGGRADLIEALTLAGVRDTAAPAACLQAHEPATLWRGIGRGRAVRGAAPEQRWRELLLGDPSASACEATPGRPAARQGR